MNNRPIPPEVIARADALMAAALQAQLIQTLTGLKPAMQTPHLLCALIQGARTSQGLK